MTPSDWLKAFRTGLDPEWQSKLPEAIEEALALAALWKFQPAGVLPGATCSLVWSGTYQGGKAVLRLPLANEERTTGFLAMRACAEYGGVDIWQEDESTGATLMPLLTPGTNLAESKLSELEQIDVAASLFLNLQSAPPVAECWTHERWFEELWEFKPSLGSPISPELLAYGKTLSRFMLDTTERQTLLHGDLHHFNILQHGEKWVAIDPKGVIGDPAFEPVAFLRNPIPSLALDRNLVERERTRIQLFAERLIEPVERVWGWAVAQVILDAAWGGPDWSMDWAIVAEALIQCRPPEAKALP